MTSDHNADETCACRDDDSFVCWAKRYDLMEPGFDALTMTVCERVENNGGPCQCACHEDDDE